MSQIPTAYDDCEMLLDLNPRAMPNIISWLRFFHAKWLHLNVTPSIHDHSLPWVFHYWYWRDPFRPNLKIAHNGRNTHMHTELYQVLTKILSLPLIPAETLQPVVWHLVARIATTSPSSEKVYTTALQILTNPDDPFTQAIHPHALLIANSTKTITISPPGLHIQAGLADSLAKLALELLHTTSPVRILEILSKPCPEIPSLPLQPEPAPTS